MTFGYTHWVPIILQTKLRPWKAEEVPLGCWARCICDRQHGDSTRYLVSAVLTGKARMGNGKDYDFADIAENWEHSTDGGKTWKPAGVTETVYE